MKKSIKIEEAMFSIMGIVKIIAIAGDRYSNYIFKEKNYKTFGINLGYKKDDYLFSCGGFLGKRMFGVLNDGMGVQHHAMEFDKSYFVGMKRNFNNIIAGVNYNYSRGDELPENKQNVTNKSLSFSLGYRF
jgi:hypothetical protein